METIGKPVTVEGRASCSPGFSLRLVLVTLAAKVQVANSDKLSEKVPCITTILNYSLARCDSNSSLNPKL